MGEFNLEIRSPFQQLRIPRIAMKIHPGDWELYETRYRLTKEFRVYGFSFDVLNNRGAAEKAFRAFYRRLKYAIGNSSMDIRGVIGLSSHDHSSHIQFIRTSGRPKRIIRGKCVKYHIHGYLGVPIEQTGLAYFVKKLLAKQDQRQAEAGLPKTRRWKSVNSNSENETLHCMPVAYIEKQCDICFRIGDISPFE